MAEPENDVGASLDAAARRLVVAIDAGVVEPVVDALDELTRAALESADRGLRGLVPLTDAAGTISEALRILAGDARYAGALQEILETDIDRLGAAYGDAPLAPVSLDIDKTLVVDVGGAPAVSELARASRFLGNELEATDRALEILSSAKARMERTVAASEAGVDVGVRLTQALRELTDRLPSTFLNPAIGLYLDMESTIGPLVSSRADTARAALGRISRRVESFEERAAAVRDVRTWTDAAWLYHKLQLLEEPPVPGAAEIELGDDVVGSVEAGASPKIRGIIARADQLIEGLGEELRRLHAEAARDAQGAQRLAIAAAVLSVATAILGATGGGGGGGGGGAPAPKPGSPAPGPGMSPPTPPVNLPPDIPGRGLVLRYFERFDNGDFQQDVITIWDPE